MNLDTQHEYEFNPRKSVSDLAFWTDRAATRSAATRAAFAHAGRARLNLRYGDSALSTLDVFCAAESNAPVHIYVHGGYWRGRDKHDYSFIADALVPHGITTVVLNYDLCPSVELPDIVVQMREALRWVRGNAAKWGGDPSRITASGHSAGAHLIAAVMSDASLDNQADELPDAALLISGIYEVEPVLKITVNDEIRLRADQVSAMSPMRRPPVGPRQLVIAVGGKETDSWIAQSREFAARSSSAGSPCLYVELPGTHHFSVLQHFETPTGWLSTLAADLAYSRFVPHAIPSQT